MNHCGTHTIETKRLLLRKFMVEDAEAMFQNWASDKEVTKFLTWPAYTSLDTAIHILNEWTTFYEKPDFYQWAIVPKNLNEPIGSISVVSINEKTQMAEIGYCIGRPWWNRGITSEALSAVINFMFDQVGANRIQAKHDVNNPHSGLVMKKCGMKYEGTLRSADVNNQGVCDVSIYALLKSDR
jgi:ribosomal-protein-alanine N-acetyltransferase